MPRTFRLAAALALMAGLVGGTAHVAAANNATPAAVDYSQDEHPSCSLHPIRNADGTVSFLHDPAKDTEARWLAIYATQGGAALEGGRWLDVGATAGPYALTDDAWIEWASARYHFGAYHSENDCGTSPPPTTTSTSPPETTSTTAPTTTTTEPTTTTTEAVPSTTTSEPTSSTTGLEVFNPTTTSVGTPPPAVPALRTATIAAKPPVVPLETRRLDGDLATTGVDDTTLIIVGIALMLAGAAATAAARNRRGGRLERDLHTGS